MEKYFKKKSDTAEPTPSTSTGVKPSSSNSVSLVRDGDLSDKVTSCVKPKRPKLSHSTGRTFQKHWAQEFNWLKYEEKNDKVFCSVCKEITLSSTPSSGLFATQTKQDLDTVKAFVEDGYSSWNKAKERFAKHEKSDFHIRCCCKKRAIDKGVNVHALLSTGKVKEMKAAREALLKMISSLRYLMTQGLAIRGHTDADSNYQNLLELIAEDNSALSSWLQRTKYKWLSHEITSEIGSILSNEVLKSLVNRLKDSQYYSVIIDETSDVSQHEQVSICFRFVSGEDFKINELFFGFYKTESTTAEQLMNILMDVLTRFSLNIESCRGIATDGAANMTGAFSGLQAKVRESEPRAIHIHCLAHSLNLVAQEAMQNETVVRDVLANIKEIVNFLRGSPKRLAIFESLQGGEDGSTNHPVSIRPYCPTRWCCRISSLKTMLQNFSELMLFFEEIELEKSDAGAKAKGFLKLLQSFQFLFVIKTLIKVLGPIEILNKFLQTSSLQLQKAMDNISSILQALKSFRGDEHFNTLWSSCMDLKNKFGVNDPKLPKARKIPRRIDSGAPPAAFTDPKDYYRKIYFELTDIVIRCLETRFSQNVMVHFKEMESFLTLKTKDCSYVESFYMDDFDPERLTLHRNMMLDICKSKNFIIDSVEDLVKFFSTNENKHVGEMIPEVVKLIKIALTIPVSTCTAERSFSALRRLKTYLRSTLTQVKLNDTSIVHIHKETAKALDIETVANSFIKKSTVRRNTFFMNDDPSK